ncbi:MAG: HAMP domain-containing histidine kinase, partial [Oscillospiraceae bacterium]|nr:HAMP domain-containing histidine kinase [Oscillospiraceae bacterium]
MKSIYLRNFFATAALVTVCFLVVAVSFMAIARSYVITEYRSDMDNSAEEVARAASAISRSDTLTSWVLGMSISSIAKSTGNQVFITDADGVVVTCSDRAPLCEHLGVVIPQEIIAQIGEDGYDELSDLGGMYSSSRYVAAYPILSVEDGSLLGFAFVTNMIENMLGSWTAFLSVALIIAVGVFGAALLASLVFTRHMARPLDEMAAASRKFARGDFSVRVKQTEDPEDEMGALIDSFNKMADSLEQAEQRRSEFIANISHELRTPMTTIAGFADGILDGTIPAQEERKYLISIRDETRRLSRLVKDMLGVSQARARAADASHRSVF